MSDFFAMGGYGAYVWIAYGVTLVGLLLLFLWSWFGARSRETELEQVRKWARAERKTPGPAPSERNNVSSQATSDMTSHSGAIPGGGATLPATAGSRASE